MPQIKGLTSSEAKKNLAKYGKNEIKRIKKTNILGNEGTDEDKKEAIIGALTLYLDFINLFLNLLRLTGKRRN